MLGTEHALLVEPLLVGRDDLTDLLRRRCRVGHEHAVAAPELPGDVEHAEPVREAWRDDLGEELPELLLADDAAARDVAAEVEVDLGPRLQGRSALGG